MPCRAEVGDCAVQRFVLELYQVGQAGLRGRQCFVLPGHCFVSQTVAYGKVASTALSIVLPIRYCSLMTVMVAMMLSS